MHISLRPPRSSQLEWLDDSQAVADELSSNLADIRRLNAWFGGTQVVKRYVGETLDERGNYSLLDIATGSADIPVALVRWARKRQIALHVVGLDADPRVLANAREIVGDLPVQLVQADARALPFDNEAFDMVTCCLALHHFNPEEAVQMLAEAWRVARRGLLVVDLTRSYLSWMGAWLATRTVARNPMTRHDGPLSVLRAYTPSEMRNLALRAGIPNARYRTHPFFRQSLLAQRSVRDA